MHPRFLEKVEGLHASYEKLIAMTPHAGTLPPTNIPVGGVYLFSEGDEPLYVGRSNRLRERYFLHTRNGSRHNQASFAFRIAVQLLDLPPPAIRRRAVARRSPSWKTSSGSLQQPRRASAT